MTTTALHRNQAIHRNYRVTPKIDKDGNTLEILSSAYEKLKYKGVEKKFGDTLYIILEWILGTIF